VTILCPWCGAIIARTPEECPECGVLLEAPSASPAKAMPHRRRMSVLLKRMLGAAVGLSVLLTTVFLLGSKVNDAGRFPAARRYADPLRESVWLAGKAAFRAHINQPYFNRFDLSSVVISAGNLVSFCGQFNFPEQGGGVYVKRFISLNGRRDNAVMEYQTPSFDTLWERLCTAAPAVPERQPPPLRRDCPPSRLAWLQGSVPEPGCASDQGPSGLH